MDFVSKSNLICDDIYILIYNKMNINKANNFHTLSKHNHSISYGCGFIIVLNSKMKFISF